MRVEGLSDSTQSMWVWYTCVSSIDKKWVMQAVSLGGDSKSDVALVQHLRCAHLLRHLNTQPD